MNKFDRTQNNKNTQLNLFSIIDCLNTEPNLSIIPTQYNHFNTWYTNFKQQPLGQISFNLNSNDYLNDFLNSKDYKDSIIHDEQPNLFSHNSNKEHFVNYSDVFYAIYKGRHEIFSKYSNNFKELMLYCSSNFEHLFTKENLISIRTSNKLPKNIEEKLSILNSHLLWLEKIYQLNSELTAIDKKEGKIGLTLINNMKKEIKGKGYYIKRFTVQKNTKFFTQTLKGSNSDDYPNNYALICIDYKNYDNDSLQNELEHLRKYGNYKLKFLITKNDNSFILNDDKSYIEIPNLQEKVNKVCNKLTECSKDI